MQNCQPHQQHVDQRLTTSYSAISLVSHCLDCSHACICSVRPHRDNQPGTLFMNANETWSHQFGGQNALSSGYSKKSGVNNVERALHFTFLRSIVTTASGYTTDLQLSKPLNPGMKSLRPTKYFYWEHHSPFLSVNTYSWNNKKLVQ